MVISNSIYYYCLLLQSNSVYNQRTFFLARISHALHILQPPNKNGSSSCSDSSCTFLQPLLLKTIRQWQSFKIQAQSQQQSKPKACFLLARFGFLASYIRWRIKNTKSIKNREPGIRFSPSFRCNRVGSWPQNRRRRDCGAAAPRCNKLGAAVEAGFAA